MWLPIKFCTLINTDYSIAWICLFDKLVVITYQILYIDQYWLQLPISTYWIKQCCDYLSNFVHWSILITAYEIFSRVNQRLWLPIKFCTLINTDYSNVKRTNDYNVVVITYQILYIDQYWLQQEVLEETLKMRCDYLSNFVHWSILITALILYHNYRLRLWLPIKFCTLINTDYSFSSGVS